MHKISPSGISSLLECSRCLWLQFNKDIKRPRGIYPSLPDGMDNAFKNYFDQFRDKGILPPELDGKVDAKLFGDVKQLHTWREFNFGRGGIRAEISEYEMTVAGAIDDILVAPDGSLIPLDFKTRGYPTKEDTHKHYQSQLDLYALLFERNGQRVATKGYLLFFWPDVYHKDGVHLKTDLVEVSVSSKRAMAVLKHVHSLIMGELPLAAPTCEYCSYREAAAGAVENES
ncbi:MAG: PD-(D/E)XK nuclease family protein [Candidatus Sungbacteria bacterium]|nr:PD-(D/E)XK nuclease family protein [Candidatus Sungbacteria bacterium]